MPRVPVYEGPTVRNQPMPLAYQRIETPEAAFDGGGAVLAKAGAQMQALGDKAFSLADKLADEDAKTAAQEALNAFQTAKRDALFHRDDAYFRQTGETAYKAYDALKKGLEDERARYGGNLSERARKLYEAASLRDLSGDLDSAARHASTEREKWRDGVTASTAESSITNAASFWNDDAKRNEQLLAGRNAILDRAHERGWEYDDPRLQTQLREFESKAAAGIIQRAVQDDPMRGRALFERYASKLSPDQYGTISRLVESKTKKYEADAALAEINRIGTVPAGVQMGDLPQAGSLAEAIHMQESGGRLGDYQIQPGTWKQYAKDGESPANAAHQKAVFERILSDLKTAAGDDPARIAVGYFSGKGNIAPAGSPTPWKEDRKDANGKAVSSYVADILARSGGSPMAAQAGQADIYQARLSAAEKIADPEVRDHVVTSITKQFNQQKAIEAQRERDARDQVLDLVMTKKVDPKDVPDDLTRLVGPDFMLKARELARREADPPPNPALYGELAREAVENPAAFVKRDLVSLKDQMPWTELKQFIGLQSGIDKKQTAALEQGAKWKPILEVAQNKLRMAGIDPTPKDNDKAGAERMAAFQGAAIKEVEAAAKAKGAPLTQDEIGKAVDRLLLQGRVVGTGVGGLFQTERLMFERKDGEKVLVPLGKIPAAERQKIASDFQAERGRLPKSEEIEKIYTLSKMGAR